MRDKRVSVSGNLMRDMIRNINDAVGKNPEREDELRKNPVEPAWICPRNYEYEIIERDNFRMEYLRPTKIFTTRVILQLHGGGYIGPLKNIYRTYAVHYSKISYGADVLSVDYRLAPEHPYPAALEDAVSSYKWLMEEKNYSPSQIVIAGDSAGGGLTLALCLYLKDHNMPLPAGLILMSPWTDLTCSGESYTENREVDPVFGNSGENMIFHSTYIGENDPKNPYISPAYGDLTGFPPMLIQVGSYEILESDSKIIAEHAKKAHVKHRLSIYEGMFHEFQMALNLMPESKEAWKEMKEFMVKIFGIDREVAGYMVRSVGGAGDKKASKSKTGSNLLNRSKLCWKAWKRYFRKNKLEIVD